MMQRSNATGVVIRRIFATFAACYGLNAAICLLYLTARNDALDRRVGWLCWISPSIGRLDSAGAKQVELLIVLWAMFFAYLCVWFLSRRFRSRFQGMPTRWYWLVVSVLVITINYGFFGYIDGDFIQFGRNGRSIFEQAVSSAFGAIVLGNLIVVVTLAVTIYMLACIRDFIRGKE